MNKRIYNYIFQSIIAGAFIFLILFLLSPLLSKAAIVAALASSVFLCFVTPYSDASYPKNLIGGHLLACITYGLYIVIAYYNSFLLQQKFIYISAAIVVSVTVLSMAILNIEHAPACGTSFGLVIHGWDWRMVVFILTAAVVLSLVRIILLKWMEDLI